MPAALSNVLIYCRYEDGSGGCDGCLDFTNMGVVFQNSRKQRFPDSGLEDRRNNNMAMTVLALEHIYTRDHSLGDGNVTLIDAGKSRADLWALAGIVAVEISVNKNNLACKSSTAKWTLTVGHGGG